MGECQITSMDQTMKGRLTWLWCSSTNKGMFLNSNEPSLQLGKKYGVSDNAIRKWCKSYNIDVKAIRSRASDKSEEGSETTGVVSQDKST